MRDSSRWNAPLWALAGLIVGAVAVLVMMPALFRGTHVGVGGGIGGIGFGVPEFLILGVIGASVLF